MYKKLLSTRILKRIYVERLGESFIYNLASFFILIFGNIVQKINYDLVPRQPYAFGLNEGFKLAVNKGVSKILIIEFGVADGAGLFNLASLSEKLNKYYGIDYEVIGFDTGVGMPEPIDYRDHPEKYFTGDFKPIKLNDSKLPTKTKIYYGEIAKTITQIKSDLDENTKIGFVSIDVDYYSSTLDCLELFQLNEKFFFHQTPVYFDDVNNPDHNEFCGELLAIKEFNEKNSKRKIAKMNQLKNWRIFKGALWLDQCYFLHAFDSRYRTPDYQKGRESIDLPNPYL